MVLGFISVLLLVLAVSCTLTSANEPTPLPSPLPPIRVQEAGTPTPLPPPPTRPIATPIFPTPIVPTSSFATPIPTVNPDLPTPRPADQTENIVEALINRVIIPLWNFVYTLLTGTVVALWDFAGVRGGLMAQFIFCMIPGIIVVMGVLWRVFRRAR